MTLDYDRKKKRKRMMQQRGILRRFAGNHNANKTHCANGHPYRGNNVALRIRNRDGRVFVERRCVECRRKQRHGSERRR